MDVISTPGFQNHVETLMEEYHVPGLSIATFNSESIQAKGFGKASLDRDQYATEDTLYDWASCSKSITAAAVGKLVDAEKCKWASVVAEILPEFVLQDADKTASVTIEDLLSHRTGMPGHDLAFYGESAAEPDTPESIVRKLRDLPSAAPSRTKYIYMNMMFTVASRVVEALSGKKFADYLKEEIFDVLEMESAYLQPRNAATSPHAKLMADGHTWDKETQKHSSVPLRDQPEGQGAGLIQASVIDFAKWVQAMLTRNTKLFSEDIYSDLVQPRIVCNPEDTEDDFNPCEGYTMYALGWSIVTYRGHRLVCHGGSELGFRSGIYFLPAKDFGLVVVGNSAGSEEVQEVIANELLDRVLSVESDMDWPKNRRDRVVKEQAEDAEKIKKLRAKLSGNGEQKERGPASSLPVSAYKGKYFNKGYKAIVVSEKNAVPFVEARDRGLPFTLEFEHVHDNTEFIAYLNDEAICPLEAQFKLDKGDKATSVGIQLEAEIEDMIWFEKQ